MSTQPKSEHHNTSGLNKKGRDFLSRLLNSIERLHQLVDSLLIYSKTSSKNITFTEANLNDIVQEVVEDLEPYIKEANGQISWDHLPVVSADKIQMKPMFQNFITNSLKFNDQTDKYIHIHATQPKDHRLEKKIIHDGSSAYLYRR